VNTGSIVEHLTPTYFIRGKIHLHIDLTVSFSVYAKFESLKITLTTLREQLKLENFFDKNYSWEILKFVSLTHDRVQDLSHEVDSILELNWIKNKRPQPPRRHRRGLFDLGGRILKGIFGTATTADLETLEHKFQLFTDHAVHTQQSLVDIKDQLFENTMALNRTIQAVNSMATTLSSMQYNHTLESSIIMINTKLNIIYQFIREILHTHDIVQSSLDLAYTHKSSSLLLSSKLILPIVENATKTLLLYPVIEVYYPKLYREFLKHTWSMVGLVPYSLDVIIPLTDNNPFVTNKIHPFPTPIFDNSRVVYNTLTPYVFTSNHTGKITKLLQYSDNDFSMCTQGSSFIVCPILQPILEINSTETNCVTTIIQGKSNSNCIFNKYIKNKPYLVCIQNVCVLSLQDELVANVNCPLRDSITITLPKLYTFHSKCSIASIQFNYHSSKQLYYDLPYFNNLKLPVSLNLTIITNTSSSFVIPSLENPTWDKRLDHLSNITNSHGSLLEYTIPATYFSFSTTTIVIVITIIIAIIMVVKKCQQPVVAVPIYSNPKPHSAQSELN
jgi:hypothetical protein